MCAAQIAARDGRFDDARRHYLDAFEAVEQSEDLPLVAAMWADAMEIEADRLAEPRMRGAKRLAEIDATRAVADDLSDRTRTMIDRLTARGVGSLPDAAAHLAVAAAEHARVWGRYDPDAWAAIAAQWEALGFTYPTATARFREADATLRTRGPRERAGAAARAALASAQHLGAVPLADAVRQLAQRGRLDLDQPVEVAPPPFDPLRDLGISPREGEVLGLLAVGRTNRQIGEQLFISEKTASVHVTHLLRKLGVTSRVEAGAIGQRLGLGS